MILFFLLVGVLILLYYLLAVKPFSYWSKRNVKTGKVTPFFGDNLWVVLGKENFADMFQRIYNKLPDERYIGAYQFRSPVLILRSPELIKQLCVKDFDHFLNRNVMIPDGADELICRNLFALKGQTWKNMRCTLSPSFTSSKMKAMFVLMSHNADLFVQHFVKKNEKIIEVELKDAFTRFANDIIASLAFGLEVDSLGDKENEFYMMGKQGTDFVSLRKRLTFSLYLFAPIIAKFFRVPFISERVRIFFTDLVKNTIKLREEKNIKRPDMLGLLIDARKGQQNKETSDEIEETSFAAVEEHLEVKNIRQELTDADITSHLFIFFIAGFETVSSTMCFMAYELAINPDIQKKLIEEIDENRPQDGKPSYETVANMTYLDMVVTETFRKWPLAIQTDRTVNKPYTIHPELPDEKPLHLNINDIIVVPLYSIQHDPKYYPDPEKFDPERFSPENRNNIDPYTYLPFGVGPRNCIGSRFALLEIKAMFFHLLSYFEIVPVEKTNIPLKINKSSFIITSDNGFPLGLKRRN